MPAQVLVAYSTRAGSTGEVAEAIAAAVREAGLTAEVGRMRDWKTVEDCGDCGAVILGAPLYMGGLPGEAHRFFSHNRRALHLAKTWIFVLGPMEAKPEQFKLARSQAEKQLTKYSWFVPANLEIFVGRFDVDHMPFPFSLARHLPAFPAKNLPATDNRDWGAIRDWAAGIAKQVALATSPD